MKKIIALLTVALLTVSVACARDRVSRNVSDLPVGAQTMLTKYFPKTPLSHIKIDSGFLSGNEYDVVLTDGTQIEFDSKGNWKEIDCGANSVPAALILKPISDYVRANFKGQKIVQIQVERTHYDVELSSGLDLKFDRAGRFQRIDD